MLNMLEKILNQKSFNYLRLDGDVKIPLRDGICTKFNNDPDIFCFLLTA
jgi:SNF2 family DNA or RNA helicase